jgi:ATP-binding cassette, subfamily B, multidrug efflux pump
VSGTPALGSAGLRPALPFGRLLRYLGPYWRSFAFGLFCAVAAAGLTLGSPMIVKQAIDSLHRGTGGADVWRAGGLLIAVACGGAGARFLMRRFSIGAARHVEHDVRNALFAQLQRLDLAYFQRSRTGDLMSRATADLHTVRTMVGQTFMHVSITVLSMLSGVALVLSIHGRLGTLALLPLLAVLASTPWVGALNRRCFRRVHEQLAAVTGAAHEALANVRLVRAYVQEGPQLDRFRALNDEYVRRNLGSIRVQTVYQPSVAMLVGVSALVVIWQGTYEVRAGRLTVGELVTIQVYLTMMAGLLRAFGYTSSQLQRGMAAWRRVMALLDEVPAIRGGDAGTAPSAAAIRGDVELRDVTFAYGDDVVLRDVSMVLPAGTTTALVGATGAGKSTLLGLVPRLRDPQAGAVLVDGVDVREWPLATLRRAIGFVSQEPILFNGSIAENIAFGLSSEESTGQRTAHVARVAGLADDVERFPLAYETMVGERGVTLSGGQRQRAALARALAPAPRILVLDDALSAVDAHTEAEIMDRIGAAPVRPTAIIVSHRVSTVRRADQILVLAGGRIVERGTHEELRAKGGAYSELYNRQLIAEELEAL